MKRTLTALALSSLLGGEPLATFGQQHASESATADVVIEAPSATPLPAPSSGSKSKKPKTPAPPVPRRGSTAEIKSFSFNRAFSAERLARPLIIRNTKADAKTFSQLQEDLAVMARLIEKSASEFREEHEEAAGIPILTLGGSRGVRSIYLEDYGVVFTLTVNLPLKPESKPEEAEEKREGSQNEEWLQARNELFGDRRAGNRAEFATKRDFDPRQVEEFRNALIETVRNAGNIRNLRPDDWVTLVVRGRGFEPEGDNQLDVMIRNSGGSGGFASAGGPSTAEDRTAETSTMVLRVKKSALDEFTRSKGGPEEFRQKVSVTLY